MTGRVAARQVYRHPSPRPGRERYPSQHLINCTANRPACPVFSTHRAVGDGGVSPSTLPDELNQARFIELIKLLLVTSLHYCPFSCLCTAISLWFVYIDEIGTNKLHSNSTTEHSARTWDTGTDKNNTTQK